MKVRKSEVEKLKERLKEIGAEEEKVSDKNVFSRLKVGEGVINIYKTGSITFGGKGKEGLKEKVEKILEEFIPKRLPIVGCDEAGKGEFFGPLVIACVVADRRCYRELLKLGVKDSKRMRREEIVRKAERIKKACRGKVKVLMPKEYNRLYGKFKNQNRLMEEIYLRLLKEIYEKLKFKEVIIDKFSRKLEEKLKEKLPKVEVKVIEKGEEEPVVAAAAVVAKAERLKRLKELSEKLGTEVKEGNSSNSEVIKALKGKDREEFVKLHFKVGGESEES
ncbi:ribonuclease HIII [Thermovibrio sp.]